MLARLAIVFPVYWVIYACCFSLAYLLRYDFRLPIHGQQELAYALPWVLAFRTAWLLGTREWRRRHRYTTMTDIKSLVAGAAAGAAAIYAGNFAFEMGIPRSVVLLDALLNIVAVGGLRAAVRLWSELARPASGAAQRTLIYGCDSGAVSLLRSLQVSGSEYLVVGLIDPRTHTPPALIAGKPVFGIDRLNEAAQRLRAQHLLVPNSVPGQRVRELIHLLHESGVKAHVIPAVSEIVEGKIKLAIRDVTIEDLLRRPPMQLDMQQIRGYIEGKRVLVTGGAGSIGSELCRQVLALKPQSLVLLDQSEFGVFAMEQELARADSDVEIHYAICDILDGDALNQIVAAHRPHLVFHAAAYKHVPLMESNPREAIRNNVFGTRNVVDAADRHDVEALVLISTDKAVRPTSVMGSTKLVAEKYLQAIASRSSVRLVTVRFGNVLNSMGSVVPTFRRQIEAGGPVTVTHPDMVRYFMTIPEAVQLVLQAGAIGQSGDLLILDMGEPVKIVDLAKDMIELSGLNYPHDIEIAFTGLRPGEKLYEELFYESEKTFHRVHEKIFLAPRSAVSLQLTQSQMKQLERAVTTTQDVRQTLGRVVDALVASEDYSPAALRAA